MYFDAEIECSIIVERLKEVEQSSLHNPNHDVQLLISANTENGAISSIMEKYRYDSGLIPTFISLTVSICVKMTHKDIFDYSIF